MKLRRMSSLAAACALALVLAAVPWLPGDARAAETVFPVGSRIGLVPPAGMQAAKGFPGFENDGRNAFIRLIAMPAQAFGEIERTMTNEAIRKQGMAVEKREQVKFGNGHAILVVANQNTPNGRIKKWLMIAPLEGMTAMASFEMLAKPPLPYGDAEIRTAFTTLVARDKIPDAEQLSLVPFKIGDTAGLRLVRVVPGVAAQFTDGPKDSIEAGEQPHLVIAAAPGGPRQQNDRDQFARNVLSGLPPLKDVRVVSSESMRIGGQPGHEVRAQGKDPQNGSEIEIVQWLRFGSGAYLRILGLGPKENWTATFMRFRAVRDGLEPR